MRAVLDTNVIVSGLIYFGNERRALGYGLSGRFELVLSPFILDEAAGVLADKFDRTEADTSRSIHELRAAATIVEPRETPDVVGGGHPDNRILALAAEAGADYLVTGDRRHLLPIGEYEGTRILRAPDLLAVLEQA